MEIATQRSMHTGVMTLRVAGDLTVATVPQLRQAGAKAAGECPTALLVDLAGLGDAPPRLLSVFPTMARHAQQAWGVPVVLCSAAPGVARKLASWRNLVTLYPTSAAARRALRAHVPRWRRRHFAPDPACAAAVRTLVGDACLGWNLTGLFDAARLAATELAANAIVHARTEFDVTVAYTGVYLRIAVHDASSAMPSPGADPAELHGGRPAESGRGLWIVGKLATHWGFLPVPDGKIVWALMRAGPARRPT
jgi:ABC-type transporter Mla MlaB component